MSPLAHRMGVSGSKMGASARVPPHTSQHNSQGAGVNQPHRAALMAGTTLLANLTTVFRRATTAALWSGSGYRLGLRALSTFLGDVVGTLAK